MRRPSLATAALIASLTGALILIGAPSSSDKGQRTARDSTTAAPAAAASWQTVFSDGFEGTTWPLGNWLVSDYNGPAVGTKPAPQATVIWDDNSTRAKNGIWAAHPNDYNGYSDYTDTWMRWGPFSLQNATDARLKFAYWLDSEETYDLFSYSYACSNLSKWTTQDVSGELESWRNTTLSLKPCVGKAKVWVRFNFKSDLSTPSGYTGVWVDDILIQKFAP